MKYIVIILFWICFWFGCTENGKNQATEIKQGGIKTYVEQIWYGDNQTKENK